ncbi:HAD-IA family hydrolase [Reichenbachiella agariperforans]|uniref:Phosphonatase-like hydrolase n=1 Tax=Reichenbachiella agariperforans TaxID=156994 RepID=A0A1M6V3Z0_REIAG|nr:HAD-IA family hydrolase [Reichenbachiella agariperforans]MBU2912928.1 HAD-IA family hydrolase [Reichenbachiella agariperforans]SHK76163.1 phosphonatase-like hydrolase [Reichenbachiella agariperforans]
MNLNGIELVVFDMAGTTVEEGKTVYQCVKKALERVGIHLELEEVFRAVGGMNKTEGINQLIDAHAPETSDEEREAVNADFFKILIKKYEETDEIKAFPGAVELFAELHNRGIKVALDTGYSREIVDLLLKRLGWTGSDLIDFTVTSDEVESGRPSPEMIQKIMAHFGITDAQRVVKVGDTQSDMEEGLNAQCKYIVGVASNMYSREELTALGATHVVSNLMEIMDYAKV